MRRGRITNECVCAETHTVVLSEAGHVYAWGQNHKGQVGTGDFKDYSRPKYLKLDQLAVVQVRLASKLGRERRFAPVVVIAFLVTLMVMKMQGRLWQQRHHGPRRERRSLRLW